MAQENLQVKGWGSLEHSPFQQSPLHSRPLDDGTVLRGLLGLCGHIPTWVNK